MTQHPVHTQHVPGPVGPLAVHLCGPANGTPVVLSHSILAASMMWDEQAQLLAEQGYRVIAMDTRGHGQSAASAPPYRMDDLVADTLAVLDGLGIAKAHYIGLSLGGMSGFGLASQHGERVLSAILCDCRADMPAEMGAVWNERMSLARAQGCGALAMPTLARWFGAAFLEQNPALRDAFVRTLSATQVDGFVGCAQAIQGLDYMAQVDRIAVPVTLIVGANDGPLPQAMQHLQTRIRGSQLVVIDDAGHLPNIDQAHAFNRALLAHFAAHG
jgi:3-oxoadipate enol-lactonase